MERLNQSLMKTNNELPIKVLQFGEGNFLRAFVDWMIYEMNNKADFNAGVAVVQPMPFGMIDKFVDQDGYYHHMMNGIKNGKAVTEINCIDVLKTFVNPYEAYEDYLALADQETIQFIVSNTTEAGIDYDESDLLEGPQKSYPGKLTAWLYRRYQTFNGDKSKGLVVLPCELIDRNGDKLKEIILKYADQWMLGQAFINWINDAIIFANTLVDRIVPGFPKDKIESVYNEIGCEDHVVCESEIFHLWVIEGPQIIAESIPFEKAGLNVIVTDDMSPYRTRKVRILNGAHTLLVPVGLLYGIDQVRESIEDEVIGQFVVKAIDEEVIPTIQMPLEELNQFKMDVLDRFRNPFVKHYLKSISLNSISKFKTRVLPSMLGMIKTNQSPNLSLFSLASLMRLYKGDIIEIKDDADVLAFFNDLWSANASKPEYIAQKVLSNVDFWGEDLTTYPGVLDTVSTHLKQIEKDEYASLVKTLIS